MILGKLPSKHTLGKKLSDLENAYRVALAAYLSRPLAWSALLHAFWAWAKSDCRTKKFLCAAHIVKFRPTGDLLSLVFGREEIPGLTIGWRVANTGIADNMLHSQQPESLPSSGLGPGSVMTM